MQDSIVRQIEELREMTVGELREKYRAVYGEECRSYNKDWLWKRIAWRIQELKYGGLSERAKRRAKEIANEADIRLRVPKGAFDDIEGERPKKTSRLVNTLIPSDHRLPMTGSVISRSYKGVVHSVTVLDDGFAYNGRLYKSLSAIAKEITGSHWNGFKFFNL